MPSVEIPLRSRKYPGLVALVDEDDADLVLPYRWWPRKCLTTSRDLFYAMTTGINGQSVSMHRLINQTPPGMETDHINGNGLDNRKANLRSVTSSQNLANWHTDVRSALGYIGVHERKTKSGTRYHAIVRGAIVGIFDTAEDAAREVDRIRRIIWGECVRLNFPDERPPIDGVVRIGRERTSKFRGVCWDERQERWESRIIVNGKKVFIGRFDSELDAARAYDEAAAQLRGGRGRANLRNVDVL